MLLWRSTQLVGFGADGATLVDGCDLLGVPSAQAVGTVCPPDFAVDGTPLTEVPEVARRLRAMGAPAAQGKWSHDDLFVRWSVDATGVVFYELRSDASGARSEMASFPGPSTMPFDVRVSPDGRWLALVDVRPNDADQVKILNVDEVAARVR